MRAVIPALLAFTLLMSGCEISNPFERLTHTPPISNMPPSVNKEMDEVLHEFEAEAIKNQPEIETSLFPGISEEALTAAEAALGKSIHPEMAAFYRWHNGAADGTDLIPGHEFYPLERAIQLNQDLNREYRERGVQFLMAHEAAWLTLFPDPAGDGYYYDYEKDYANGGVFYNFRETGYYIYFPSMKNLLTAFTECYRQGAYQGAETLDFALEQNIMIQYGIEYVP